MHIQIENLKAVTWLMVMWQAAKLDDSYLTGFDGPMDADIH